MAAYTCEKCGHMMLDNQLREEAQYSVLMSDLRKLVEEMREEVKASNSLRKGWNDVSRRLHSWADRFDRLLEGE